MRWDLFCRVIDNHGDAGVCWRLACELARRGDAVRLWIDDASALAWMAPQGQAGVQVLDWNAPPPDAVGDVVVEAFGCDPPASFVQAMQREQPAPLWINLEYLSAEPYVERSHGLRSPATGQRTLDKWFFYPGFGARTGGLLRESGLLQRRARFDAPAWLAAQGWAPLPNERVVSLFCYTQPRLQDWLEQLGCQPTLLLAARGGAQEQLRSCRIPGAVRAVSLPWLTQPDYDHVLWSCQLNFVRGEDSFVRAQWAAAPFVWQAYPQHDGAHAAKLEAFLDRFLAGAPAGLAGAVRRAMRAWNGLADTVPELPRPVPWTEWCRHWCQTLAQHDDLATALRRACVEKLGARMLE